jgi:hypothetical protein
MKALTKLKLIRIFKRIIGYKDPPIQPYIVNERKIQKLQLNYQLPKDEIDLLNREEDFIKTEIENRIAVNMAKSMLHIGAIKIDWTFGEDNSVKLNATTYVPENL